MWPGVGAGGAGLLWCTPNTIFYIDWFKQNTRYSFSQKYNLLSFTSPDCGIRVNRQLCCENSVIKCLWLHPNGDIKHSVTVINMLKSIY